MPTNQKNPKSSQKLAQYYQNHWCFSAQAHRFFSKDYDVNHQIAAKKYLESENPELIGFTALHFSSKYNYNVDIEYILSLGADPMIKCRSNLTPLLLVIAEECERLDHFSVRKPGCVALLSAQVKMGNSENPRNKKNGLSHFHIACMADHAEAIEMFLKIGLSVDENTDMDSPHFPGYTPLHLAARFFAPQAIRVLLNYGANAQAKNAKGMTFLHTLIEARTEIIQPASHYESNFGNPHVEVINFLLQNDSHVVNHTGLTKFHLACCIPDSSIAESLLPSITDINHGLDMNAPSCPGFTALHFAAYSSLEMVKMLVRNGANMSARDAKGTTPLDMCAEEYGPEVIHDILSLDVNFKSILMSDRKTRLLSLIYAMKDTYQFDNFLESRLQIANTFVPRDAPVWQGFTPLHVAVTFYENYMLVRGQQNKGKDERSEHIIRKLVTLGASINARDVHGRSPLNLTFRQRIKKNPDRYLSQEYVVRKATKLLLELFSDKIEDVVDEDNLSHLHVACQMLDKASVEKILQTTVDVNVAFRGPSEVASISDGMTPLHCAARSNEIVTLLLLRGADPLSKDANGMTPIHHSIGGSEAIFSSPNLKDCVVEKTGLSHLHVAAYSGNVAAVGKLLDEGADMKGVLLKDRIFYDRDTFAGRNSFDIADKTEVIELMLRRGLEFLVDKPVKIFSPESYRLRELVQSLSHDDPLFRRLENEIGLTTLHVACSKRDLHSMRELLAAGADVSARIDVKSRLWPGCTPLHVVALHDSALDNLTEAVRLLLDKGADVTMTRLVDDETAVHLIYDRMSRSRKKEKLCLSTMLRAQSDFAVNPTRSDGLSHFFVACDIGDVAIVKKFLKHGSADVNRSLAGFKSYIELLGTVGYTPLHAVTDHRSAEHPVVQLELVDLLLNHGADTEAEEFANASTPLAFVLVNKPERESIIARMIRSNANPAHRDILGYTPLEWLLTNHNITIDRVNKFLELGFPFNVFNCRSDKGLIGLALALVPHNEQVHFIKSTMINLPRVMRTDETGRTVIHNIVSTKVTFVQSGSYFYAPIISVPVVTANQYTTLIRELEKFGLNVDDQDNLGRTALHLATLFRNTHAICGLLTAGADVNVTDASGKTAFSYMFQSCVRCAEMDDGRLRENHMLAEHFDIFSIFVLHMKKLLRCELDVNEINENLMFETLEKFKFKDMKLPIVYEDQINEIRNFKITESMKLTLGKFMSETDAVVAYSTLQESDRDAIDKFFKDDFSDFLVKYNQVGGILLLQYRKAIKRAVLNKSANPATTY